MGDAADDDRRRFVAGVYAEWGPRLYRYALMIVADRQDAEDVLHQVFAAVLSKRTLPAIDDAGRVLQDRRPQRRVFAVAASAEPPVTAEELILEPVVPGCSPAEQAALEQALRALPPEQREVVHLHVYEGMTFQEVANATAESINTVAARYRYALDKMRKMIL